LFKLVKVMTRHDLYEKYRVNYKVVNEYLNKISDEIEKSRNQWNVLIA